MTLFKLKYQDKPLKICIANSLEDLLNSAKEKFNLDPDETYKAENHEKLNPLNHVNPVNAVQNISQFEVIDAVLQTVVWDKVPYRLLDDCRNGKVLTKHEKKK
ncbi:hypothetical protein TKK_0019358 [Trichogramma kaykai]